MDTRRFDSQPSQQIDNKKCEELLWEKAGEVSELIQGLQTEVANLYVELQEMRKRGSSIGNDDDFKHKDKRYWEVLREIDDLKAKENRLQRLIEKVTEGTVVVEDLAEFVSEEEIQGPQLSKRRRKMLEDEEKMRGRGDGYIAEDGFLVKGPAPTTRLTTGRHAGAIKGAQLNSFNAEAVFAHSTTDTHGGKVGYGKKSDSYTSAAGKRVRKK